MYGSYEWKQRKQPVLQLVLTSYQLPKHRSRQVDHLCQLLSLVEKKRPLLLHHRQVNLKIKKKKKKKQW